MAWNLFVFPCKGQLAFWFSSFLPGLCPGGRLKRRVKVFDEAKGALGEWRVYGYDEWEGLRLAVTQVYRRGRLRVLVLTAFKPDARIQWPPRPARR